MTHYLLDLALHILLDLGNNTKTVSPMMKILILREQSLENE